MKRTCLALAAIASAAAPTALAENQIWTSLDFKKKLASVPGVELTVASEFRFQPDGDLNTFAIRPGIGYKLNDTFKISGGYRYGDAAQWA